LRRADAFEMMRSERNLQIGALFDTYDADAEIFLIDHLRVLFR